MKRLRHDTPRLFSTRLPSGSGLEEKGAPIPNFGVVRVRLRKEEADCTERRVQEVTGWNDPVEEKTGFVDAA